MKRAPLLLACLFALPGSGAPKPVPPCQARVLMQQQDQLLTVTGRCRSLLSGPAHYRYRLVVVREGSSGRSQNTQGGEFTLLPSQEAVLSQVRLNTGPADHYSAHLLVFDESGQAVARDSVVH